MATVTSPRPPFSTGPMLERFGLNSRVIDTKALASAVQHCRKRRVLLPTLGQLRAPSQLAAETTNRLAGLLPDAADPRNLFRIHWFNGQSRSAQVDCPAHLVLPQALTGVEAPIIVMLGDRFPMIRAHKVLAAYACLAPALVTGQFDPVEQRAIWPSTGNFCRGGIAVSAIMGCRGVAVLPENMSKERFEWLAAWVADSEDIVRTPGSESNVKEIYDACSELALDPRNLVFNQFCDFRNYVAHYHITGSALSTIIESLLASSTIGSLHSFVAASGSAGTLAAGDHLAEAFGARIAAVEAAQCPTLTRNGFGEHHIQGIGDKHVPFIHNVLNTSDLLAVDDGACDALFYLANDPAGQKYLHERRQVAVETIGSLQHIGLSGWANVLAAIRMAHAYNLDARQAVVTIATDGAQLYYSERPRILRERFAGDFDYTTAAETYARYVLGATAMEHVELDRKERERVFNLGYFTWVEQQNVPLDSFVARRRPSFWRDLQPLLGEWDSLITDFNARTAVRL